MVKNFIVGIFVVIYYVCLVLPLFGGSIAIILYRGFDASKSIDVLIGLSLALLLYVFSFYFIYIFSNRAQIKNSKNEVISRKKSFLIALVGSPILYAFLIGLMFTFFVKG